MKLGINELYPTKVLYSKIQNDALREEFINFLFENVDVINPPSEITGRDLLGGVKDPVVKRWMDEEVKTVFDNYFQQTIGHTLSEYKRIYSTWLTGTQGNYSMLMHNHSGSTLSAVFYLLTEEKQHGGELVFCDPRTNANRGYVTELQPEFQYTRFQPSTGDVLVFPSYMYHFVTPFVGKLRLCLPVDLFLDKDDR